MQCWCKSNGEDKAKSIESAEARIKAGNGSQQVCSNCSALSAATPFRSRSLRALYRSVQLCQGLEARTEELAATSSRLASEISTSEDQRRKISRPCRAEVETSRDHMSRKLA